MVLHFCSNNPVYWLLHCHIITDKLEGMSVVISEVESRHSPAPIGFPTCGGFHISPEQYYESVLYDPDSSGNKPAYNIWWLMLVILLSSFASSV